MNIAGNKVIAGKAEIWKDEQGVIHVKPLKNVFFEVEDLVQQHMAVLSLSDTKKDLLVVVYVDRMKGMSQEARAFISTKDMTETHKAIAGVVNSPMGRVIGTFFLGINKPDFAVKLFSSPEGAVKWLSGFKAKKAA